MVDVLHFEDDVVGDADLGEEDVELAGHATGNWVDCEADVDVILFQNFGDFSNGILGMPHSHPIARHDHNILRIDHHLGHRLNIRLHMLLMLDLGRHLARRRPRPKDHIIERPVHRLAHNIRQDGTRRPNQTTNNRQHRVVEHEALGAEGPARVAVEDGDGDGHVGAADGVGDVPAENE